MMKDYLCKQRHLEHDGKQTTSYWQGKRYPMSRDKAIRLAKLGKIELPKTKTKTVTK